MEGSIINLDLLSLGISVAAIGILGFVVFLNNRRSITNQTFLYFCISGILWATFNYFYNQFSNAGLVLLLLRVHAFFAVWYVFFIFQIFYVFPKEKVRFPKTYTMGLVPFVVFTSLLTLTPAVFSDVTGFSKEGYISSVSNWLGIYLF